MLGEGRKQLPASFLNRFTKIHVLQPDLEEIQWVVSSLNRESPKSSLVTQQLLGVLAREMQQQHPHSYYGIRDYLKFNTLVNCPQDILDFAPLIFQV